MLEELNARYQWPNAPPDVEPNWGPPWFLDDEKTGHTASLLRLVGQQTRVIVELGSFVGRSTACFLRICPHAHVIAIDTWMGSPEHHADPSLAELLPNIFHIFQRNLWAYRCRLTAIRETTIEGMRIVHEYGVAPDLVYVDADHSTQAVVNDILTIRRLFPQTRIVGDDWFWDTVRNGVIIAASELMMEITTQGTVWWLTDSA